MLGATADHEARDIVQEHQRNFLLVTDHDEAGRFVSRIGVDHTPKLHFAFTGFYYEAVVGDDADAPAVDAGVAAEYCLSIFLFEFSKFSVIHQGFDEVVASVGFGAVFGQHLHDVIGFLRKRRFGAVKVGLYGCWHPAYEVADGSQAFMVVLTFIINDSGDGGVHFCSAQVCCVYFFADGSADQIRPRKENTSGSFNDQ